MDDKTIAAAVGQDANAFAEIYRRYAPALYAFFFRRVGDANDAEDLTATTFSKMLTSLARYRERGRFEAWLFGVARHVLLDERRRRRTHIDLKTLAPRLADPAPPPEAEVIRSEEARQLRALLAELPADQRAALVLRFFGDLSIDEIAALMGRSAGAVKMLIHRAMTTLRERYRQAQRTATRLIGCVRNWIAGPPAPSYAPQLVRLLPRPSTTHDACWRTSF
ncbi:MAG TPA: sigma-70 family RNA polymerase sigma factor [Roseiflexaceae bacterium]|nr:sigma-70 family RNA polymerase sigma factor [Roseiflexaceae bacterium]